MVISWFSAPSSGSFSSFYQYDTTTSQFTRIRLELGRGGGDGGDTFSRYKPSRAVGFTNDPDISRKPYSDWTIEDGVLKYKGAPLETTPKPGYRVFDATDPSSFVHKGSIITDSPTLPDGIEPKHLALIANDTMINKTNIKFTDSTASADDLAAALKGHVCDIIGKDDFTQITDSDILQKLKSQVKEIQQSSTSDEQDIVDSKLSDIEQSLSETEEVIKQQIELGELTPNETFESAFSSLKSSISKAKTASGSDDIKQAMQEMSDAQKLLTTAMEHIDEAMKESITESLKQSSSALDEASKAGSEWDAIESEYSQLSEADSIKSYEDELGIGEEEPIVDVAV